MRELKRHSQVAIAVSNYQMSSAAGPAVSLLTFKKDDIIIITGSGESVPWWRGYLQRDPQKQIGIFPREAVQTLCGDFVSMASAAFQFTVLLFDYIVLKKKA